MLVVGGRQRQINVSLDAGRLQAHNLTVTDVSRALQAQNTEIPGGRVEAGRAVAHAADARPRAVGRRSSATSSYASGTGIRSCSATSATVEDGMADANTSANVDGEPTVLLTIRRQSGTNTVQVVDAVKERLADHQGRDAARLQRPRRPRSVGVHQGIDRHASRSTWSSARFSRRSSSWSSSWNWRSTLIAAIAIPTSIIATFGLIWYKGFTLNSMTMLALTLAVGIVIDDAIVVLENIYRFIEEKGTTSSSGGDRGDQARSASRCWRPRCRSSPSSCRSASWAGIVGRFMKSFGLTMAFAIMVSLLVSFTLTPMLSARWIKMRQRREDAEAQLRITVEGRAASSTRSTRATRRLLVVVAGAPRLSWPALAVLVLLSSVPLFMVANKNFLPNDDQSEFEIDLRAPEGTSLDATEVIANRIATAVRRDSGGGLHAGDRSPTTRPQTQNLGNDLRPSEAARTSARAISSRS